MNQPCGMGKGNRFCTAWRIRGRGTWPSVRSLLEGIGSPTNSVAMRRSSSLLEMVTCALLSTEHALMVRHEIAPLEEVGPVAQRRADRLDAGHEDELLAL